MLYSPHTGKPKTMVEIWLEEGIVTDKSGYSKVNWEYLLDKLLPLEAELEALREKVNGKIDKDEAVSKERLRLEKEWEDYQKRKEQ